MKMLVSQRIIETELSTIGKFHSNDNVVNGYFLEPPKGVRIPAGTYDLIIHNNGDRWNTKTFPPAGVLEMVGVPGHTAVLIHPGNFPKDTHDCNLPGDSHGVDCVNNSKEKMKEIMVYMPEKIQILDIVV